MKAKLTRSELNRIRATKHGLRYTKEYMIWVQMKARCTNKRHKQYKDYGGRGITVCDRWLDVTNFYKDMGKQPGKRYGIERVDVNLGYNPSNCIWLPNNLQSRNRRNVRFINGIPAAEFARNHNISKATFYRKLNIGMPLDQIVGTYGKDV